MQCNISEEDRATTLSGLGEDIFINFVPMEDPRIFVRLDTCWNRESHGITTEECRWLMVILFDGMVENFRSCTHKPSPMIPGSQRTSNLLYPPFRWLLTTPMNRLGEKERSLIENVQCNWFVVLTAST